MLLSFTIRNVGRCAAQSLIRQQINQPNRLTPISCYHNFHRKEDELFRNQTGFLNNRIDLHKTIHSSSALFLKYSNILEQKVEKNETKIEADKASDEAKSLDPDVVISELEQGKKLGLFARFKKMGKDYWYVLIPVHVATSAVWLGAFYYTSKSGVDIVGIMEYYEFSETIVKQLRDSRLGHIAVAYFLYKVATPARYTVTLGGTTFAIKFLSQRGIIKPMPSKDKLVQIYKDKKEDLHQKVADKKQEFRQELQDKKQEFKDKYMKQD